MTFLKEKIQKKTVGFWIACASSVIALITLIMFAVYRSKGGEGSAVVVACLLIGIVAHIALFFYDGKFGDFIAIVPAFLYALGAASAIGGGVGNLADWASNIVLFGVKELAPLTIAMAAVGMVASILAIVSCFMTREKIEK